MIGQMMWAALLSLLPARYRGHSSLEGSRQLVHAAAFCGFCQVILFSFVLIGAFITKSTAIWEQASSAVLNTGSGPTMDPVQVRLTTGFLGVTTFMLQPLHLLYTYLAIEGAIRAFAAFAFVHVLPTFPLWLISAIPAWLAGRAQSIEISALSKDMIQPARDTTYDVHVLSHAAKDWSPYIGIQFDGNLYVLVGEESETGPRPFGYKLRRNLEGSLMVVVRNYSP